MGLFSFFSKEKKETLDKGLEKTKTGFFDKIARAIAGRDKVDEDVLDNLEEVLVTSDVGVETKVKRFTFVAFANDESVAHCVGDCAVISK